MSTAVRPREQQLPHKGEAGGGSTRARVWMGSFHCHWWDRAGTTNVAGDWPAGCSNAKSTECESGVASRLTSTTLAPAERADGTRPAAG